MSNHVHVVLYVDKDEANSWSTDEVLSRYHKLHKGTLLTQKHVREEALSPEERITLNETVKEDRRRLFNMSWLMRDLNEYITQKANKEDHCTGRADSNHKHF